MDLKTFIRETGIRQSQLAAKIGVQESRLSRWVSGKARPEWAMIAAIEAATDGKVTAADFVPAPPDPDAVAADMQRRRAQRTAPTQATVRCEVV